MTQQNEWLNKFKCVMSFLDDPWNVIVMKTSRFQVDPNKKVFMTNIILKALPQEDKKDWPEIKEIDEGHY